MTGVVAAVIVGLAALDSRAAGWIYTEKIYRRKDHTEMLNKRRKTLYSTPRTERRR